MKARMGRPPLADGKTKAIVFTLRLSVEERQAIVAAAERAGAKPTLWARGVLVREAEMIPGGNGRSSACRR